MKNRKLKVATWLLSRFVPNGAREALLGDLTEEYARLVKAGHPDAPLGWYLRHISGSIPPLLCAGLARATWPMTLGVALVAYALLTFPTQWFVQWAVRSLPAKIELPVELVVLIPTVFLIGYLAERIRRGTLIALGTLLLLTIVAQIIWGNAGNAPIQSQLVWLFLGPEVIFVGVVINRRRSSAR
jgi:hypothetical protein